jgi:hypothetical protein
MVFKRLERQERSEPQTRKGRTKMKKTALAAKKDEKVEGKERKVRISAPELETIRVRIEGIGEGLIVKAMSAKVIKAIEDSQTGKGKRGTAKSARVPEEEYEDCFHKTPDGKYAVRAIWFKKAMETMATFSEGLYKKDVKCGIFVHGDLLPFVKHSAPWMRTDWVRLGGMSKKTSLCYRPQFDTWEVELKITVDLGILSVDEAVNLLSVAGTRNGIGERRMQTSGDSFGCFRIKTIESGK